MLQQFCNHIKSFFDPSLLAIQTHLRKIGGLEPVLHRLVEVSFQPGSLNIGDLDAAAFHFQAYPKIKGVAQKKHSRKA